MTDAFATTFATIAFAMFVAELTDKDALLLLALATRNRTLTVFLAGSTAFVLTTVVNVTVGSVAVAFVDVRWIKLAGGGVMIAYALWEARGIIGKGIIEEEEEKLAKAKGGLRAFLLMVGTLALLDLAGDATMVLTIVFVAQYSEPLLVFSATCVGLIAATGAETALGNRLGKMLTPRRIRYVSVAIFLVLGTFIAVTSFL
ncbi:MAG: TMEM165/GDT1 family protein [Thaumarchaeota archaeon]|nr:TMEM165/GDT1 family protein [Nitrososphaerota archaeon]